MAWDDGMTHSQCGIDGCPHCHCHWCAEALRRERDEARRLLVEFGWSIEPCGDRGLTSQQWKNRLLELDWFLPLSDVLDGEMEGQP